MSDKCCEITIYIVVIILAVSVLFGFIGGLMIDYWLINDIDPFYSEMVNSYLEYYTRIRLIIESILLGFTIITILAIPFEECCVVFGMIYSVVFIGLGVTIAVFTCLIMVEESNSKCKNQYEKFVTRFKTMDMSSTPAKWYMQVIPNLTAANYSSAISQFVQTNCNPDYTSRAISLGVGFAWTVCMFLSPVVGGFLITIFLDCFEDCCCCCC